MTDRPIIFSAPMVRALLDGRKTQTRRLLKPQPPAEAHMVRCYTENPPRPTLRNTVGWFVPEAGDLWPCNDEDRIRLRYAPGDRLWVKEAWRVGAWDHRRGGIAVDYPADKRARKEWLYPHDTEQLQRIVDQSRADAAAAGLMKSGAEWEYCWSPGNSPCRVRPSIHMPRWASRLTLTVTEVRVQRLQEISEADAVAEGVEMESADPPFYYVPGIWPHSITAVGIEEPGSLHAARSFAKLWNSLHGDGAWDQNPWVTAISFTVERRNIDA